MKVKITYTLETEYSFDDKEILNLVKEYGDGSSAKDILGAWIHEDFERVETRADNVLRAPFTSTLTLDFKGEQI